MKMQKCTFCNIFTDWLRRAFCIRNRRHSNDSYYRELGDQDTLKIEDKSSELSENVEEINQETQRARSPSLDLHLELTNMPARNVKATGQFLTMQKRRKKRLMTRSLEQETALLDDLNQGQVQCILTQAAQWEFNAFTLDNVSGGRCLPVLCVHLFHKYGLLAHFKLDAAKAWKLFSLIEEGYHANNPYHNSVHAADVTQAMHCFLQQKQIRDHLEPLDIMASILAAMSHDLDHPGVNQHFLVSTSNHLATLYQNTSVLENHHWRMAISCLFQSGITDHMGDLQAKLVMQMNSLILATDITRQQEYLSQFKNHLDSNTLDLKKSEHRHLVLQIALKCADISNPCRPWKTSRKWSLKVCDEFFRQGDFERKINLPVSPLCDRHTTSIPKIQTGFFKFVVTPLITEWHRFLQNDLSEKMLKNLHYNQSQWEMLVAQETGEEDLPLSGHPTRPSNATVVEEDQETGSGANISGSSEMLLPPRRSSLNPTKRGGFKEQLRRLSVPLNVFHDSKLKNSDKNRASSVAESPSQGEMSAVSSEQVLLSQLSVPGPATSEKVLSTEKLLPESSITSITTPLQATKLNTLIKQSGSWKLVRQQTFPPLETAARAHSFACRPNYTSNEDTIYSSRYKIDSVYRTKMDMYRRSIFKKNDTDKTDIDDASGNINKRNLDKDNWNLVPKGAIGRRESATVGSQLRDNLTSIQLGALESDPLLRRRKSMPANVVAYTPKEKKMREMPAGIPQFLRRTLSSKEAWTQRRGSAPAPIAPSELRGLTALGALHHSANGGRRKPSPIGTCQQWLAKTTNMVQERPFIQLPRRSSLPVEVFPRIDAMKTSESV